MAKLKIQHTYTGGAGYQAGASVTVDSYVSPTQINGTNIGGTGGDNDQTVPTIRIRYLRETTSAVDTGYIRAQKGSMKFRVNNTSDANTSIVTLVNALSTELATANTATILCNVATINGANIANNGARTSAYVTYIAGNVTGVQTPVVGHQLSGTGLTGNVTVTALNSTGNITVSCSNQTVTNTQANIKETFNVQHISNKFVWDWSENKYRYYLGQPYNTGSVLSSQPAWQGVVLVNVDNN
jgi:hypothetical protein